MALATPPLNHSIAHSARRGEERGEGKREGGVGEGG